MKSERERKARKDDKGRLLKKGEGQDKNGRYFYDYFDRDRKRHRIYNTDLVELRKQEKDIQKDVEDGIDIQAGKRTINEQFERYMKTKDLKQWTEAHYRESWDRYMKDTIGKLKLADVKKSDLQIFYKSLKDKGIADSSIRHYSSCLVNPVLELAVNDDIIRKNPNKGCAKEYNKKGKSRVALTAEQQQAFIQYVGGSDNYRIYEPLFQVMFSTAGRVGEVLGLRWSDVDFEKREISINHHTTYKNYGDGTRFHAETPKNETSVRIIPMTQNCYRALKLQREYQFATTKDRDRETAGLRGYVFTTSKGTPYTYVNINNLIKKLVRYHNEQETEKAAQEKRQPQLIPKISCHNFRHTGCTRLAETRMDIKALQEYMGHGDIRTTMNIYNHVDHDRMKKELEQAERISGII